MRKHLVVIAALVLAACAESALPGEQWVRARATGDAAIEVTNLGIEPVWFRIVDPTELVLMAACTTETCTRVGPGETVEVPYSAIEYYDPGDSQASVTWWSWRSDGSAARQGSVIVNL